MVAHWTEEERVCKACGKTFYPVQITQQYCCFSCRYEQVKSDKRTVYKYTPTANTKIDYTPNEDKIKRIAVEARAEGKTYGQYVFEHGVGYEVTKINFPPWVRPRYGK